MFKTESGNLGLAYEAKVGDIICILYGCTVPVFMERHEKEKASTKDEEFEDRVEILKDCVRRLERNYERKIRYKKKKENATEAQLAELKKFRNGINKTLKKEKELRVAEREQREKRERKAKRRRTGRTGNAEFEKKVAKAKEEDPLLYYKFKGGCYINGMMDGEAMRKKFYEEIPDRVFELR
jgi:hypothetical protein